MHGKHTLHPYCRNLFRTETSHHQTTQLNLLFIQVRIFMNKFIMKTIERDIYIMIKIIPTGRYQLITFNNIKIVQFVKQPFTFLFARIFKHGNLFSNLKSRKIN